LLYNIQVRLNEVLDNIPNKFVARITRVLTFPLGKPYKRPSDELVHKVAAIILKPGALRDRLTKDVYIPTDNKESIAQLEDALERSVAAEPAIRKIHAAIKAGDLPHGDPEDFIDEGVAADVITETEAAGIRTAIAARKVVIQVDDFLHEYLTKERKEWGNSNLDGVAGQSM
jgi:acyl-CoA dehydrogenase